MQEPKNRAVVNHLFILDESASMKPICNLALSAYNETLRSIQSDFDLNGTHHRITFLSSRAGGIQQRYFDQPADKLEELKEDGYKPHGSGLLMDCIGLGIGLMQVG